MNKKGAEMSTNTIILLIIGLIVLVVLILGFTLGWDKLAPWLSKENVDDVVNGCAIACNTQAEYAFCTQTRTLIDSDKNEYKNASCFVLSEHPDTAKYRIEECPSLDCGTFTAGTFTGEGKVKTYTPSS